MCFHRFKFYIIFAGSFNLSDNMLLALNSARCALANGFFNMWFIYHGNFLLLLIILPDSSNGMNKSRSFLTMPILLYVDATTTLLKYQPLVHQIQFSLKKLQHIFLHAMKIVWFFRIVLQPMGLNLLLSTAHEHQAHRW